MSIHISDEQKQLFRDEGYMILPGVIPHEQLEMLRGECARFMAQMDAEMDAMGVETLGITHKGNRYFVSLKHKESERLGEFLFGDVMAEVCRATLGPDAVLFYEQYVVKAAERGMKFGWHQDSGYVNSEHEPYLSCWCPLDDVSEENGTVSILPYSRAGTRDWVRHRPEAGTNDMVGYFGDDPGIQAQVPAGSVVAFSSTLFHRSGTNTTDKMRRVYLAQYARAPIAGADGNQFGLAEPFLQGGEVVSK
jgi:ectoine hydroxylase-related dioxygenase (phytanoyl-CoA dioxygenase family)